MNTTWQNGLQTITEDMTPFEATTLHNLLNVNDVTHSIVKPNRDLRTRDTTYITYPVGASSIVRACIDRARDRAAELTKAAA